MQPEVANIRLLWEWNELMLRFWWGLGRHEKEKGWRRGGVQEGGEGLVGHPAELGAPEMRLHSSSSWRGPDVTGRQAGRQADSPSQWLHHPDHSYLAAVAPGWRCPACPDWSYNQWIKLGKIWNNFKYRYQNLFSHEEWKPQWKWGHELQQMLSVKEKISV